MGKSQEFVGVEYEDLRGLYVAAKKDLKALGERLNFHSVRVDEMAIEIGKLCWKTDPTVLDHNLVQHSYIFIVELVGVPEFAETGSKEHVENGRTEKRTSYISAK